MGSLTRSPERGALLLAQWLAESTPLLQPGPENLDDMLRWKQAIDGETHLGLSHGERAILGVVYWLNLRYSDDNPIDLPEILALDAVWRDRIATILGQVIRHG